MANNQQVAEAFVRGQEARSAHMHSTGNRLYSYALQIAHYDPHLNGIQLDYTERKEHTVTTQRHMRELERVMRQSR